MSSSASPATAGPPPPNSSEPNNTSTSTTLPALDFTSNAPTDLPSPPFIPVEGVPNFRELGGYAGSGSNGGTTSLRRNYLFRCATLAQITPAGTTTLTQHLNIHTLYDLRSQPEINSALKSAGPGGLDIPGVTRHFVPVYKDEDYSPEALGRKYAMYTAADEDPAHGYSAGFVRAYRDIAQHAGPAYRKILEHVRDRPAEPLVFHCTAGKDRTGVLAALVLRLCGVPDEVVAWEYGITEQGLGDWKRVIVQRMMGVSGGGFTPSTGDEKEGEGEGKKGEGQAEAGGEANSRRQGMSREQAERIVGSRAKNMTVFLREVLDGEFGGVRKYLKDYCGFSDEDVDRIRKNLMVEDGEVVSPPEGRDSEGKPAGTKTKMKMGLAVDGDSGREEKVMAG